MKQITDFQIGQYYRICGNRGIGHNFKVGDKVKVVGYRNHDLGCINENWLNSQGEIYPLYQVISLVDLSLPWPRAKYLLREDSSLYLTRYTLLWLPWLKIRLHHIHLSDYDCLHDHPWDFVSIMLKGGYFEIREKKIREWVMGWPSKIVKRWIRPGSFLYRRAEDKHRLEIPAGHSAWTLVFMFKRRREWGFWRRGKFIHHKDYTSKQTCE